MAKQWVLRTFGDMQWGQLMKPVELTPRAECHVTWAEFGMLIHRVHSRDDQTKFAPSHCFAVHRGWYWGCIHRTPKTLQRISYLVLVLQDLPTMYEVWDTQFPSDNILQYYSTSKTTRNSPRVVMGRCRATIRYITRAPKVFFRNSATIRALFNIIAHAHTYVRYQLYWKRTLDTLQLDHQTTYRVR